MRIALVNWSSRKVGGIETYLDGILSGLVSAGHEVSLLHERDEPVDRPRVRMPDGAARWCVTELGREQSLAQLRRWRPDVIYGQGVLDPTLESGTLDIAPAVFFAHAYYGACISGTKLFRLPVMRPCSRRFGWRCLALYYPRRCGGLSPVTMLREYRRQSWRLRLLRRYEAVVTHSRHMRQEYLKHGLPADRVHDFRFGAAHGIRPRDGDEPRTPVATPQEAHRPFRLLFMGRMDAGKGGPLLLRALPIVIAALKRGVTMTFLGDGPLRTLWQEQAARIAAGAVGLGVHFDGWVSAAEERTRHLAASDLLVVPSVWPEPFGLVGADAAGSGLPVAAFAVGGIPEWLADGVNGHLASASPPTAEGLAAAIVSCLSDPDHHARLRRGAGDMAGQFSLDLHTAGLIRLFERVATARRMR